MSKSTMQAENPDDISLIKSLAEKGKPLAQYVLGQWYFFGDAGLPQNRELAVYWLQKSACQGNARAKLMLGICNYEGAGTSEDKEKAIGFLEKAEELGRNDPNAQFLIGKSYLDGKIAPYDAKVAVAWLKKSAEQGCANAQVLLGECFRKGEGVRQDKAEASYWFKMAAEQGNAFAQYGLCLCLFFDGSASGRDEAIRWCRKSAAQGNIQAQVFLGACLYFSGKPEDKAEAAFWFQKSEGNDIAQFLLGRCCFYGEGVHQDKEQAVYWYAKSAEQGNRYAQLSLGECYLYGEGVAKDREKAAFWFAKSAEQGNLEGREQQRPKILRENSVGLNSKLEELLKGTVGTWQERLMKRIWDSGKKESDVYKKAHISKSLFSKIRSDKNHSPKKETVIALGIGLELDIDAMEEFMAEAGYVFSEISPSDLIVRDCILHRNFDMLDINRRLYEKDLPIFGDEKIKGKNRKISKCQL